MSVLSVLKTPACLNNKSQYFCLNLSGTLSVTAFRIWSCDREDEGASDERPMALTESSWKNSSVTSWVRNRQRSVLCLCLVVQRSAGMTVECQLAPSPR